MGKIRNFIGNTLGLPVRGGVATPVLAGLDTLQAGANVFTNIGEVVENTKDQVRSVLSSPYAKGPMKRYHRVGGALTSPFIAAGTLVEGAVRAVLEPARNAILNVRDIAGNLFKNLGESLLWTFDTTRPVSDFSFNHLKMKKPTGKNWLSKLAWWKKKAPAPAATAPAPAATAPAPAATAPAPAATAPAPAATAPAPAPTAPALTAPAPAATAPAPTGRGAPRPTPIPTA